MQKYIHINPEDNVIVAVDKLMKGEQVLLDGFSLEIEEDIPAGHKVALQDFQPGTRIVKYGYPIGHAREFIRKGSWVNEKNIRTNLEGLQEYTYTPQTVPKPLSFESLSFLGYRRKNGDVGIRNEIWIIPTVGCVNGIVGQLASELQKETRGKGVDAIVSFPHNYGCSQLGRDHENTRKILRDMVLHPNVGAVLIVGLGCENNQISEFREMLGDYDAERIRFMETQYVDDEIETGMQILRELYCIASTDQRIEIPMSELKIGLKCGGSDGFSGITANPLLGVFSDYLVAQGGTAVLTEVPEMFGAETILMNRCESEAVFERTVHLINNFKSYFIENKQAIYENPSPGNKAGGISTLEEKSLGCTQKAGTSTVRNVLEYGERLVTKGLNLLSAPGNDLVASTALAAAGCHIVLFTTGRGTPFGTFVPTVKISTNSDLFSRKPNWIDFNAGVLLESKTMHSLSKEFISFLIDVVSGKLVNNELNNYREIAIFKTGVTL